MTIKKHYNLSPREYSLIHSRLRHKLSTIAFNNYYHCSICGCHNNLQIHIPNCNPDLINSPGFFSILCPSCHNKQ